MVHVLQIEGYSRKLWEIETLFTGMESGSLPVNDAQMEKAIRTAEDIVTDLQRNAQTLSGKSFIIVIHHRYLKDQSISHFLISQHMLIPFRMVTRHLKHGESLSMHCISVTPQCISHSVCEAFGLYVKCKDLMLVTCFVLFYWIESEKDLQARLSDISTTQLSEGRDIQVISNTINNIKLQDQRYQRQVSDIQTLIHDVRRKLEEARLNIKQAVSYIVVQ